MTPDWKDYIEPAVRSEDWQQQLDCQASNAARDPGMSEQYVQRAMQTGFALGFAAALRAARQPS